MIPPWLNHKIASGRIIQPPTDYKQKYLLDGTDLITRIGGDDFRISPACPEAIGSQFDGATQYYDAGIDSADFWGAENGFTLCFWLKTTDSISRAIFAHGSPALGGNGFHILTSIDRLQIHSNGDKTTKSTGIINDGKWHFCSCSYDGANAIYHIDGMLSGKAPMTFNVVTGAGTARIGSTGTSLFFNGGLDQVYYYARVLSDQEIKSLYFDICDFNPSLIQTSSWINPERQDTITQSLGSVSQIDDLSPNKFNMTQPTSSKQPKTLIREFNGINVLDCDGNDSIENLLYPINSSIMFFLVAQIDSTVNSWDSIISCDNGTSDFQLQAGSTPQWNNKLQISGAGNISYTSINFPFTGVHIFEIVFDFSINKSSLYVDGVFEGTGGYLTQLDAVQKYYIFRNRGGSGEPDGAFGQAIVIPYVDTSIREKIEGYLAWYYGTVSQLPAGHTYKSTPPKR